MDFGDYDIVNAGRLINCNRCSACAGMLLVEEALHVGRGDMWEIPVYSAQFCCEVTPLWKNKT